ncbi:MAG: PilZ domain-containing protein [Candidatus Manganitrophus sp.]|nr:PilZ domain-containing protein [Candidatus Manganitrophus sp.]WDT69595.1 MAG: PilZ domain-containing protein [Candidatus Manganitrophus sp.]WDT78805.1 MAG: PilZ domain-containing protein [Candidatus Manganitrophus sp.]
MDSFILALENRDDKRKHPRLPVVSKATLLSELPFVKVMITNMSLSGLLFHSRKWLDFGKTVALQIEGRFRKESFREVVTGKIVAVNRGGVGYSYGVQFDEVLTLENQPSLYRYLQASKRSAVRE